MRRVLLLNASQEIVSLIKWQRAVALLMQGKVAKPAGYDEHYEISTTSGVFRLPTALVLVQYVRIPYKCVAITKENVLRRDGHVCAYCGCTLTNSTCTIDHITPTSRGGKHTWKNIVASCKRCNNRKDNKTPEEAHMPLKKNPFVPTRDILLMTAIELTTNEMWTRWVPV